MKTLLIKCFLQRIMDPSTVLLKCSHVHCSTADCSYAVVWHSICKLCHIKYEQILRTLWVRHIMHNSVMNNKHQPRCNEKEVTFASNDISRCVAHECHFHWCYLSYEFCVEKRISCVCLCGFHAISVVFTCVSPMMLETIDKQCSVFPTVHLLNFYY